MKRELEKQYNPFAEKYTNLHVGENHKSTEVFFKEMEEILQLPRVKNRLLDLGCGAGTDFEFYQSQGFKCFGIDGSVTMCNLVNNSNWKVKVRLGDFSNKIPFRKNTFDFVVSKWAIQTACNIQPVYEEVVRVLISGGYFIFLTVHPFRQFIEKKKSGKNYFKQEVVASEIFDKQITVYEPTHTLQEYLSPYFLQHFELLEIKEDYEFPAAEQIGGDIYPTHLIVVARKK